jgi:hypothetical protein
VISLPLSSYSVSGGASSSSDILGVDPPDHRHQGAEMLRDGEEYEIA